jgi:hypothetical protein
MPWKGWAYRIMWNPFDDRSLVESVYSSFKQRMKTFFNTITANPA